MALYFFNVFNGNGATLDPEGEDFPDLGSARDYAVQSVRSILSDELKSAGMFNLQGRIEVVDQHASVVLTLPFREAVDLRLDDSPPGREHA